MTGPKDVNKLAAELQVVLALPGTQSLAFTSIPDYQRTWKIRDDACLEPMGRNSEAEEILRQVLSLRRIVQGQSPQWVRQTCYALHAPEWSSYMRPGGKRKKPLARKPKQRILERAEHFLKETLLTARGMIGAPRCGSTSAAAEA